MTTEENKSALSAADSLIDHLAGEGIACEVGLCRHRNQMVLCVYYLRGADIRTCPYEWAGLAVTATMIVAE